MTQARILLVGYYGKGNFGDDVLLTVTHRLLKAALPQATISVIADGKNAGYVARMLGDVSVLAPGRHGHFDLIVHGGGGVFFDFKTHGLRDHFVEMLLRIVGFRTYVAAEKIARVVAGKPRSSARHRLGLGIGVGTYTPGSPRLRASLPILADFAALWVRDAESITNLKRFSGAMKAKLLTGSDLAFLTEYWCPPLLQEKPVSSRPRLGIILRDWPPVAAGASHEKIAETLAMLARDYAITGFVFDQHTDPETQRLLAPYTTQIWQPETMTIAAFSEQLAAQDVLLTSRAHGAICGACLGVPSVIVGIEPKLAQVAAMLPNASILVDAASPEHWPSAVARARSISPETIATDVANNRAASEAAFALMRGYLA